MLQGNIQSFIRLKWCVQSFKARLGKVFDETTFLSQKNDKYNLELANRALNQAREYLCPKLDDLLACNQPNMQVSRSFLEQYYSVLYSDSKEKRNSRLATFRIELKGAVSATPLFLFTSGDDKLNCSK